MTEPTHDIYVSSATGNDQNRGVSVSSPVATLEQALDLAWGREVTNLWVAAGTYGTPGQILRFGQQTPSIQVNTWDSATPQTPLPPATGFPVVMRNEWRWDNADLRFAGGFRFEHSSANILFHLERSAELSVDDCQIIGTGSGACTFGGNNVTQQFRCFNLRNGQPAFLDYTAASTPIVVQNFYGSTLWMSSSFPNDSYEFRTAFGSGSGQIGIYSVLGGEVFLSNFEMANSGAGLGGIGILGVRDTTIMRASAPDANLSEGDDESFGITGYGTAVEIQHDSVFTGRSADGIHGNLNGIVTRWGARGSWPSGAGPAGNTNNTLQLSDSQYVESII